MFANITNIMNNETILNYVNSNYNTYYSNNDTIADAVYFNITAILYATNVSIMNNQTVYNMINAVCDNDTDTNNYQNNETLSNWIGSHIFAGSGIIWNGSQITATSTNGTGSGGGNSNETLWQMFANLTNLMNNQTILNHIQANCETVTGSADLCDGSDAVGAGETYNLNISDQYGNQIAIEDSEILNITGNGSVIVNVSVNDIIITGTDSDTTYTAGSGIYLDGTTFHATATNASGGGGNSNETLWQMFANLTQIMNNQTVYNMINAVSDNDTDTTYSGGTGIYIDGTTIHATSSNDTDTTIPAQANETVGHFVNSYIFTGEGLVWNGSQMIATSVNGTSNAMNNDTIANALDNQSKISLLNTSWARNLFSGLSGIVYDSGTGQITATSVNGTSNAMNNETVGHFVNSYIFTGEGLVWNGSQMIATATNASGGGGNSNETLWQMFMNISGGNFTGDVSGTSFYTSSNVGIGTPTASRKLQIKDSGNTNNPSFDITTVGQTDDAFISYTNSWAETTWSAGMDSNDHTNFKIASTIDLGTNTRLVLTPAGNAQFTGNLNASDVMGITSFTLEGRAITTWDSLNGSAAADGIGNSNETLWGMFANISNIMSNATIRTILSGGSGIVYDSATGSIVATSVNGTSNAMNNETVGHFVNSYIFTGEGLVWNGSQMIATATNASGGGGNSNETLWQMFANLSQIMNNQTVYNMINAVSDNDTDTTYTAGTGIYLDGTTFHATSTNDTDTNNYQNNETLWGMFMNITGGKFNGGLNTTETIWSHKGLIVRGGANTDWVTGKQAYLYYDTGSSATKFGSLNFGSSFNQLDYQALEHAFHTGSAAVTEKMVIESGGNVGIGTTNPAKKLEVDGEFNATNMYVQIANVTGNISVILSDGSGTIHNGSCYIHEGPNGGRLVLW